MADTTTLDALDNITRLALQVPALTARAEAAEAEVGELKVQIRALQINATPKPPGEAALEILLARQTIRAEAAEAEAAECRQERAHYGDIMTSKLSTAEAEIAMLRAELADAAAYHDAIREVFLAPGQTPFKISKQVWALHAKQSTRLAMETK